MDEIYVSTDIETDGPVPGLNSMLSFGSAAYLADKTMISTFSANLEFLPGASGDPMTMACNSGGVVAEGSSAKVIRLRSAESGNVIATLEGHKRGVNGLAFIEA